MKRIVPYSHVARNAVVAATFIIGLVGQASAAEIVYGVIDPITPKPVLPNSTISAFRHDDAVRIGAARNQFEAASILIESISNRDTTVNVTVSDLNDTAGSARIDAKNIDVKVVKPWYQASSAWKDIGSRTGIRERVLVPELLVNDDSLVRVDHRLKRNFLRIGEPQDGRYVDISEDASARGRIVLSVADLPVRDRDQLQPFQIGPNEIRQLWLTVKVPQDAPSGRYQGVVRLLMDGGEVVEVPLFLEVYAFDLAEPSILYSLFYRGILSSQGSISSEGKSETQYRAELRNMKDHGIASPTLYEAWGRDGLEKALNIREEAGFGGKPVFYVGFDTRGIVTQRQISDLVMRARMLTDIVEKYGGTNAFVYGRDEAKGADLLAQLPAWRAIRESGGKVFATGYRGHCDLVGGDLDVLVLAGDPLQSEIDKCHSRGAKIFSYANPQGGVENPYIYRKNFGLLLWKRGVDGAMTYAYQDSYGAIWNDFDHDVYRDHVFAYPTSDGVIDTIAWEGFREGVDDVRYITTLERKLMSAPTLGPDKQKTVEQATRFLEQLRRENLPPDLAGVRRQIAAFLSELE